MKSLKSLNIVLLATLLIVASSATGRAQTTQRAGDQSQSDANAPKNKKKAAADPAAPKSEGTTAPASASAPPASPASTEKSAGEPAKQQAPPVKGASMVWVNTDSGVYHQRGTRWYGKTKKGKYMTEADAVRAGYKAAKKE